MILPAARLSPSIHARRGAAFISALFLASVAVAQPAVSGTLPEDYLPALRTILQTAVAQSPQAIQASIGVIQADAGLMTARSVRHPSLAVNGSYGAGQASVESGGLKSTSTSNGAYYRLGSGMRIFEFGAINAGIEVSRIGQQIAERQYDEAYRNLVLNLRGQYLNLIRRKLTLASARYDLSQRQESLRQAEQRIQASQASADAARDPRLQMTEAQLAVEAAEFELAYATRLFSRLAGIPGLAEADIPATLPRPTDVGASLDGLYAAFAGGGAAASNQGQILALAVRQNDRQLFLANRQLWPKISLGADTGLSNNVSAAVDTLGRPSVSQASVQSSNASISASWTWWDGFATRAAKLRATASKRASELQLKNYLDETVSQASDLRAQLRIAAGQLRLAEERLAVAESQLALRRQQQANTIEIGLTQANVNHATATVHDARANYLNLWSAFVSLVGADPAMNNLPANRGRQQ